MLFKSIRVKGSRATPFRSRIFWRIPRSCDTLAAMFRRLLALVVLVACKDPKPERPPPPPAPHDGVTLLSPGTAPLQVVRYQLTKGTRTTSELVYDIESKTSDPTGNRADPDAGPAAPPGKSAGKPPAKGPLGEEWDQIAAALLTEGGI